MISVKSETLQDYKKHNKIDDIRVRRDLLNKSDEKETWSVKEKTHRRGHVKISNILQMKNATDTVKLK